jgi:hypothetical protein
MYPERGGRSIVFTHLYEPRLSIVPKWGRGLLFRQRQWMVQARSRFLRCAVAGAPVPVGMTKWDVSLTLRFRAEMTDHR